MHPQRMPEPNREENQPTVNVRDVIGHLVGESIVDITQHEEADYQRTGVSFFMLMLSNGRWLKVIFPENSKCQMEYSD